MKFILACTLIFFSSLIKGQTFDFPRNNQGSIEYYHFISIDSASGSDKKLNAFNLYNSIKEAPYLTGNKNYFDESSGNFTKMTGFILYENALINNKPAGVVLGNCKVVVLDSGFQVFISGLKYSDLVRDRYANYSPPGSKFFPLESIMNHHSGKKWELKYREIDKKISDFISNADSILNAKK